MKKYVLVVLTAVLLGSVYSCKKEQEPFTFVQMCDTQLGMGGYQHDIKTFEQAVQQINALHPDFAVICGDLVHHVSDTAYAEFKRILQGFEIPCHLAPGNHDVGKNPDAKRLAYYRETIGPDYFVFENKDVPFVVTNTQFWKGAAVVGETEKHNNWFHRSLDSLSKKHESVFVLGHYPLFLNSLEEEEKGHNLPLAKRKELLAAFEKNNVKAYLSGHTHRLAINAINDIQLVSGETTSRNFDNNPMGFRLWNVEKDTVFHQFVPLTEQFEELKVKK